MDIRLKLVDLNPEVCNQFEEQFRSFTNVEIHRGFFEDVSEYDCMVSPANSFGKMDGGIDKAIIDLFGKSLELRVQERIIKDFSGEQPVGTSFIIETENEEHPFLAHTPTMKVPQNIQGTLNVYYAMKAMLEAVEAFNKIHNNSIKTVLCPGMGTMFGEMVAEDAVRQMKMAYEHYLNPPQEMTIEFIRNRRKEIEGLLKN